MPKIIHYTIFSTFIKGFLNFPKQKIPAPPLGGLFHHSGLSSSINRTAPKSMCLESVTTRSIFRKNAAIFNTTVVISAHFHFTVQQPMPHTNTHVSFNMGARIISTGLFLHGEFHKPGLVQSAERRDMPPSRSAPTTPQTLEFPVLFTAYDGGVIRIKRLNAVF